MAKLLQLLFNSLDSETKLLTAVSSNSVDDLSSLLASGVSVNARLQKHGGNTALHIASSKGFDSCVGRLLNAGAKPDKANDFGHTPLVYALGSGYQNCSEMLFATGKSSTNTTLIWNCRSRHGISNWLGYVDHIKILLIIATPCISILGSEINSMLYQGVFQRPECMDILRMYLLCGNKLTKEQISTICVAYDREIANSEGYIVGNVIDAIEINQAIERYKLFKQWLRQFDKSVHSLQHHARLAVRRTLYPNVIYGSNQLPLPTRLKEYLIFKDEL